MKRLPVESLIRFRSVSKAWKSLIDSSDFIADYTGKVQHLLVIYYQHLRNSKEYVLYVDDDTFPRQKVSPTPPELVTMLKSSCIIGSSHGVLCLSGYFDKYNISGTPMAVLWNIQIRKAVAVVLPNDNGMGQLGFGVCRETNDPKIVYISYNNNNNNNNNNNSLEVEVFTLSTGDWRSLSNNNLPRKSIQVFVYPQVVVDGVLYWLATDKIAAMDGRYRSCNLIISFDLTCEEFGEVNLPDTLAHERFCGNLKVSKLKKSLVVIEHDDCAGRDPTFFVWMMMQDGNSKSFTKLFAIHTLDAFTLHVLEFRKSGEPILRIAEHGYSWLCDSRIAAYEPDSKHICNLGNGGIDFVLFASSYMETLLLHDQPNFIVYDKGGVSNFYEWRSNKSRVHITSRLYA